MDGFILEKMREEGLVKPEVILGALMAILVICLEAAYLHRCGFKSKKKKKVEEAIKKGHVIKAKRVSSYYTEKSIESKISDRLYSAIYVYELNGEKHEKHITWRGQEPPEYFTLYYGDGPDDVFTADDPAEGCLYVLFYFLPFVAIGMVCLLCKIFK